MPSSMAGVPTTPVATPVTQVRTPPKSSPTVTVAMTTPIVITARPSPTGTTTTQLPLPPGSLLCTVRRGFKRTTYTFPPDGLCTIITFDSLYDTGQTLAPPYKEDFQYFIETSKQYKVSEFGIGIKQDTCSDMKSMSAIVNNPATKQHLDELWNRYRIYHYGQVSGKMGFRRLVASVSVGLAGRGLGGVGITNLASNYHHWPSSTMCAVSLDMGGRWYEPCDPPGFDTPPLEYKLGKKCGYSCMKQKVLKDTQITEIARLCRAKVNATNVQYTFVAVNIDMEDGNGTCGYGPFPRLNMLKNLAEFFAFNYTSAAKVSECMRVSYKPKRRG
ncbi:hypothetical protein HPB50_023811 [Hyalomma asiaticum]|uniref:Uncharacterized protein n=1 Tax=Hyalomma asiaticum TaxID=266040 RepID=A0ACB7SSF4_HYAAI|nr:hypothetical protein HPB50_023811 [Hyalomma asiaticum]